MKLDRDLIRNLLLEMEAQEDDSSLNEKQLHEFSDKNEINFKQLVYTIEKLNEANYINANVNYASNEVYWINVNSITYEGHQFLENIRDKDIWEKTKNKLSSLASVSIPIINQVATAIIKEQLGL